jgi:hypothetical protein
MAYALLQERRWYPCAWCDYRVGVGVIWEYDARKMPREQGYPAWISYSLQHQRELTEAVIYGATHVLLDVYGTTQLTGGRHAMYEVDVREFVQVRRSTKRRRLVRVRHTDGGIIWDGNWPGNDPPPLHRAMGSLCAMCRSYTGVPMGAEHWWSTRANHITECAAVMIHARLLPRCCYNSDLLVLKIATFLALPLKCQVPITKARTQRPLACAYLTRHASYD